MSSLTPRPPFPCHPLLREIAEERRQRLVLAAEVDGVAVWNYDDAVGLETDDGEDDLWISERDLAQAPEPFDVWIAERLAERRSLSRSRTRLLRVLSHLLAALDATVDRAGTGLWESEMFRGLSRTWDVGAELSRQLRSHSPHAVLQGWLRDLDADVCLGVSQKQRLLARLADLAGTELRDHFDSVDDASGRSGLDLSNLDLQTLSALLQIENEAELRLTPTEPTGHSRSLEETEADGRVFDLDELPKWPEERLDGYASATFREYRRRVFKDPNQLRLSPPWIREADHWTDPQSDLDQAERHVSRWDADSSEPSFWHRLGVLSQLVRHGRVKHRPHLRRLLDDWWAAGGHDIQDWNSTTVLFPEHPAAVDLRSPVNDRPTRETLQIELWPRRYFRQSLLRSLDDLAKTPPGSAVRFPELDDTLHLILGIGRRWTQRLLPNFEASMALPRDTTRRLLEDPTSDLIWEAVEAAYEMNWHEALQAALDHPRLLTGLLYDTSGNPAKRLRSWLPQGLRALEDLPPGRIPRGRHETFAFLGPPLLHLSRLGPSTTLRRVAGACLLLSTTQPTIFDHQLAAAIVWHRCRHLP